METRLFHSVLLVGVVQFGCGPRGPSLDPATVDFRGGVLGRDTRNRLSQIGLKLQGQDLEMVYRDVAAANRNIIAGRGTGAEMMFGAGGGKIFAINQDVPGEGYLAERSRRILGRAMREHMKKIPPFSGAKRVSICQWDLAVTTAAIFAKPKNVQAIFKNLSELPESAFKYDTGNPQFQILFNLDATNSLDVTLCLAGPWGQVRKDFPEPLRTIMDEAHKVATKEASRRETWKKANSGKPLPREFFAPPPGGVVYLD